MFLASKNKTNSCKGMTLLELLISIAMASLLIAGMTNTVSQALKVKEEISSQAQLQHELDFAFSRIVRITQSSSLLILPLSDNPASDWPENIRVQTFPTSAPVGSSIKAGDKTITPHFAMGLHKDHKAMAGFVFRMPF